MFAMLLAGIACGENVGGVDAPAPLREFSGDPDSLPSLPPGTIVAPLTLDLAGALAALEQIVPKRFGNITRRLSLPGSQRKSYAFEVTRDPFSVSFAADTVVLAAIIHYKGRGWYDPPIGPDINGECGTSGERPRARLVLHAVPRLSKDWKLRVHARMAGVTPLTATERDQCEVSFLKLDVTGKVLTGARQALEKSLPQVERRIAGLDLKTPLAKIWADLQKPIRLTDSLWLLLRPAAVNLGGMSSSRTEVGAEIGISASPRVVTGARPANRPIPLPELGPIRSDQGFALLMEGAFDYGVMSAELTSRLAGHSVRAGGGVLEVKKITVFGIGSGRLALGVDFDGTAHGRVWLIGRPSYDAASGMLSVPDLDFDAASAGLLLQGLAWLRGNAIREFLRTQAKIPAGGVLSQLQTLAVKQMNREVAHGVTLGVTIEKTEPAGILVLSNALIIRARATGAARLDLGPEVFEKKPPKAVASSSVPAGIPPH
jgi:hypothetical protein